VASKKTPNVKNLEALGAERLAELLIEIVPAMPPPSTVCGSNWQAHRVWRKSRERSASDWQRSQLALFR
jgi:hypothetical protein